MYVLPLTSWHSRSLVIHCTCLKMSCNSKIPGCRAKEIEVWDLSIYMYGVAFWVIPCTYMTSMNDCATLQVPFAVGVKENAN